MSSVRYFNAHVWTGDHRRPAASSVTIRDGRVNDLDGDAAGEGRDVDLHGAFVLPGLIDTHVHLLLGGHHLGQLDLSAVRSRREFEAAIARRHRQLPPGEWLVAHGWSQENWGGSLPHKQWLAAAEDRPVVCHRMDLHAALVNDPVLSQCDPGQDPPGGRIVRDQIGRPTGLLIEAAAWKLVNSLIPSASAGQKKAALLDAQMHAHRYGLTTVGSMEYISSIEDAYRPLRDQLTLRCRITQLDRNWPMEFDFAREFDNDERLAVIGCKAFLDGTLGSRSARLLEDYADDPGNRGLLVELAESGDLQAWAHAVAAQGLQPAMHAIGDEAAHLALDVVQRLDPEVRPRIEHAQQVGESDFARFRGVIASMQPLHKADDGCYARARLGETRLSGTFAFRRLLESEARLAFGSDWPVVSLDPLEGIRAAVTGVTKTGEVFLPDQNLTVQQAVRAYTAGAAHALRLDDAGVVRVGALGDLTVLDRDPFVADWLTDPPRVVMTIIGGQIVCGA